ncbi:MAG: hypothetical protein RXR01_10855 [Thermoproteus sp.]
MGMEGMGKDKRKIALEILDEADKIMEMAKMLADEDDPFARRGLYAFMDAEMKALRTLVIWCFPRNNSPFSLYSDGVGSTFSAPPPPRPRLVPR